MALFWSCFAALIVVSSSLPVEKELENPMENPDLFEGDILWDDTDRNAVVQKERRWPGGIIPYVIDEELAKHSDAIKSAMAKIGESTCIKFVPYDGTQEGYIKVFKGKGCYSKWGYMGGGEQPVSFSDNCHLFGIYLHELMHAVGFAHEQNRSDRDDYIEVFYENIKPGSLPVEKSLENPMENPDLFEGDILWDDTDRTATRKISRRWPDGIVPYVIDKELEKQSDEIVKAMVKISERTCVKFVPYDGTQAGYIKVFKGEGCFSKWGYMGGGEQPLSFGENCHVFGIYLHELMHTLGFAHELNRPDRDDYLQILHDNVMGRALPQFKKFRPEEVWLINSFDYDSIMMPADDFFSKNPKKWKTIVPKKPGVTLTGPTVKVDISPSDSERVNVLYKLVR